MTSSHAASPFAPPGRQVDASALTKRLRHKRMAEAKMGYKAQLGERLRVFLAQNPNGFTFEGLVDFVYDVSLESWKNGLAAGERERRPSMKVARIKGTALENGLLKPVMQEA